MLDIKGDTKVLDFAPIERVVADVEAIKKFKGQELSPATQSVRSAIRSTVEDWKALDPTEFHTAEGLDALKQKIGDIRDAQEFNSPARKVASDVFGAIRSQITKAAPEYAKVMKGYEEASDLIGELEKTLTGTSKTPIDTTLRKLQSVLRNNANTAYGRRAELANFLSSAAPDLLPRLAGMALEPLTPRGLGKVVAPGTAAGAVAIGNLPAAAGALALSSPRIVGEAAFGGGRGLGLAQRGISALPATPSAIGQTIFQAGRAARESDTEN